MKTDWKKNQKRHRLNKGFTLIELMVGIVLGLIVVLGVMQVYRVWDARQRSLLSNNDAQTTGVLAGFTLDRDIRAAAHGFGTSYADTGGGTGVVGCSIQAYNSILPTAQSFSIPFVPVRIAQGASGASDTISVLHGDSSYMVKGQGVIGSSDGSVSVASMAGIHAGDRIVLVNKTPSDPCKLVEVTSTTDPSGLVFNYGSGPYVYFYAPAENRSATLNLAASGASASPEFSYLFNLGPDAAYDTWSVSGGATSTLNKVDALSRLSTLPEPIAEDVVNLQAQYGIGGNGQVTTWSDSLASGGWGDVVAIRFAILVRGRNFVRDMPSGATAAPRWAGGDFVMTNVDGTTGGASDLANDWRYYRYRVYESVVPLRNVVWGGLNGQ